MEPKLLGRRRRKLEGLMWPMRAVVLCGCYLLASTVVYPLLAWPLNVLAGGLLAAAAVGVELVATAKLRRQPVARLAKWRLLMADRVLAGRDALVNQQREPHDLHASAPPAFTPLPHGDDGDGHADARREFDADIIDGDAVELTDEH